MILHIHRVWKLIKEQDYFSDNNRNKNICLLNLQLRSSPGCWYTSFTVQESYNPFINSFIHFTCHLVQLRVAGLEAGGCTSSYQAGGRVHLGQVANTERLTAIHAHSHIHMSCTRDVWYHRLTYPLNSWALLNGQRKKHRFCCNFTIEIIITIKETPQNPRRTDDGKQPRS